MGRVDIVGRVLPLAVLVVESVAVGCQFVQTTDPRFPLVYFTIGSAVLAGVTAGLTLNCNTFRFLAALQIAAAVGVVIAALVFAAVIVPATPTGTWIQPHDDAWVRTATILMHGVAPPLVCLGVPAASLGTYLRCAYPWPLVYLLTMAALTRFGVAMPYPFLSPAQTGWAGVLAVMAILAAVIAGVAVALHGLSRLLHRSPH